MKYETIALDVKLAAGGTSGDGIASRVGDFVNGTVVVHGTFSATVQLQGKISPREATNDDWVDIGTPFTTAGFIALADAGGAPLSFSHIRVKTTAFVNGAPLASFGGLQSRSL